MPPGGDLWVEPGRNMRKEIEEKLGITAIDIYGLSEVIGPGVASECLEQNGLHVFEDHFLVEWLIRRQGNHCPRGKGEVVFTTPTKEAFPVIRYRTRDISIIYLEPCGLRADHDE